MANLLRLAAVCAIFALLCACAGKPVAVKARGQVEMGFGYGER